MTENRELFLARLYAPLGRAAFSEEEAARIEMAYDLAKHAHRWQERKDGTRYFEHPRKVAIKLLDELGLYDFESAVAALLHDGWEDAPKYVTPIKVQIIGGLGAARKLRLLSKMPKEGYVDRLRRIADWQTLAVKLCDRDDNFEDMAGQPEDFRRKQTLETRDVYLPLFRDCLAPAAPLPYRPRIAAMIDQLAFQVERNAQALGLGTAPE